MAEQAGNLPRNPSLKRSWLDCNIEDACDDRSNETPSYNEHSYGAKRSRDSSTDLQGDRGYVSSLSESHSDQQDLPEDAENHTEVDSPDGDEGLWFCTKDSSRENNTGNAAVAVENTSDTSKTRLPEPEENGVDAGVDGDSEDDNISEISGMSDLDGEGWRPMAGPMSWVQRQMMSGVDPREILKKLLQDDAVIPDDFDNLSLWKIIVQIISEPPKRLKLPEFNTLEDAVSLVKGCKKIIVLTGAGVSVSCGIPDFRSRDGVYARLAVEYPDLPDPQAMFDIHYFRRNPKPFFKFAKEMYPGQFEPSVSHKFIHTIEAHGSLLRNYTQNIDTLEQVAGIQRVLQCHGSFASATCMMCNYRVPAEAIRDEIMKQIIPKCPRCPVEEPCAILKPDIVFFGESLPEEFHHQMEKDRAECDLLIVMGSSLKVRPVALIPSDLPPNVPQILINRESLKHLNFDIELLGDCDVIVNELCHRLGEDWKAVCTSANAAREITRDEMSTPPMTSPVHLSSSDTFTKPQGQPDHYSAEESQNSQAASDESSNPAHVSPSRIQAIDSSSNLSMMGKLERTHIDSPTLLEHHPAELEKSNETSTSSKIDDDQGLSSKHKASSSQGDVETTTAASPGVARVTGDETAESEGCISPTSQSGVTNIPTPQQIEDLRSAWQPKVINLGSRLKEDTYLFISPNRYVFHGAEVYDESDRDYDSSSSSSSSSHCSDECDDLPLQEDEGPDTQVTPHHEGVQLDSTGLRHFGVFSAEKPQEGGASLSLATPPYSVTFQSPCDEAGERLSGSTPCSEQYSFSSQLAGGDVLSLKSPEYCVSSEALLIPEPSLPQFSSPAKQDMSSTGT